MRLEPVSAPRHVHRRRSIISDRYRAATAATIEALIELNRSKRPNILVSGLAITVESAQVGYLMSEICPGEVDYVTYYSNSLEEAFSGALRLARHTSKLGTTEDAHSWVLVYDPTSRLQRYFDPLAETGDIGLVRHVRFARSAEEVADAFGSRRWSAFAILDPDESAAVLLEEAHLRNMLCVIAESRSLPERGTLAQRVAGGDIYVFGENLVDFQVPFGCLSMSPAAYAVWNNPLDAMAQTSTFAASATALSLVLNTLRTCGYVTSEHESVLGDIESSRRLRNDYFHRHSNPSAADLMEAFGLDFDFDAAEGAQITLRDGTTLLDCALGNGANLRGHNPPDFADAISRHDEAIDYNHKLAELLSVLSGFEVTVPAVSGATSVENALFLARMARPTKPRIVTFNGNFSGKTIPTLNVSRHGPQRSASIKDAFAPYYPDVIFVNPFGRGAADDLIAALSGGDVGLVWCELVQGMSCRAIPDELLQIIASLKHDMGYLIGIDEVLTGVWRSADTFLLAQSWLPDVVDIASIAKPLSDMMVPVAATLTTTEVIWSCRQTNDAAVDQLLKRYRNNLCAHVAWHALQSVNTEAAREHRRLAEGQLREGLVRLADRSPLYESVQGHGMHVRLIANSRLFPFRENSLMGELLGQAFEDLILRRCRVILGRGRFFPPLFPPPDTIAQAVSRLEYGLEGVTAFTVYVNLLRNVAGLASFAVRRWVRRLRPQSDGGQTIDGRDRCSGEFPHGHSPR